MGGGGCGSIKSWLTCAFLCAGISTLIAKGVYDAAFPLHDVSGSFQCIYLNIPERRRCFRCVAVIRLRWRPISPLPSCPADVSDVCLDSFLHNIPVSFLLLLHRETLPWWDMLRRRTTDR